MGKEMLFLGIRERRYIGGRLGNYTDDPEGQAEPVCAELERLEKIVEGQTPQGPFDLIPALME